MKKNVLILLLLSLTFIACEGPEGPRGPQGPTGAPGYSTNWYTGEVTITQNKWELFGEPNSLNSFYYAEASVPQLTQEIFNIGTVLVYLENPTGIKRILPYVLAVGVGDSESESLWTETYDFDFFEGGIGFYVTRSDFMTAEYLPETMTFHIVLMW